MHIVGHVLWGQKEKRKNCRPKMVGRWLKTTVKETGNRNVHLVAVERMEERCQVAASRLQPWFRGEVRAGSMRQVTDNKQR